VLCPDTHLSQDMRDVDAMSALFGSYGGDIVTVVHCAAQPSHDWVVRDPTLDFSVNATGTLTLLDATRRYSSSLAPTKFTVTGRISCR
jgi:CDP-paratose 2-epimerase